MISDDPRKELGFKRVGGFSTNEADPFLQSTMRLTVNHNIEYKQSIVMFAIEFLMYFYWIGTVLKILCEKPRVQFPCYVSSNMTFKGNLDVTVSIVIKGSKAKPNWQVHTKCFNCKPVHRRVKILYNKNKGYQVVNFIF